MIARSAAWSARRIAGSDGAGGGPGVGRRGFFPAPAAARHPGAVGDRREAAVLEEREGDHGQERVVVQPRPRAALEVVEPEFVRPLVGACTHTQRALIARASIRSDVRAG